METFIKYNDNIITENEKKDNEEFKPKHLNNNNINKKYYYGEYYNHIGVIDSKKKHWHTDLINYVYNSLCSELFNKFNINISIQINEFDLRSLSAGKYYCTVGFQNNNTIVGIKSNVRINCLFIAFAKFIRNIIYQYNYENPDDLFNNIYNEIIIPKLIIKGNDDIEKQNEINSIDKQIFN